MTIGKACKHGVLLYCCLCDNEFVETMREDSSQEIMSPSHPSFDQITAKIVGEIADLRTELESAQAEIARLKGVPMPEETKAYIAGLIGVNVNPAFVESQARALAAKDEEIARLREACVQAKGALVHDVMVFHRSNVAIACIDNVLAHAALQGGEGMNVSCPNCSGHKRGLET